MPRLTGNWTKAQTTNLIELYEQHPCLYNTLDPNHINRVKRARKLKEIKEKMQDISPGLTVNEIKLKIKTLQTQFLKESAKIQSSKKSGSGTDNIYKPKLWCFEQLQFLLKCNAGRNGTANVTLEEANSVNDDLIEAVENKSTDKNTRLPKKYLENKAIKAFKIVEEISERYKSRGDADEFGVYIVGKLKKIKSRAKFEALTFKITQLVQEVICEELGEDLETSVSQLPNKKNFPLTSGISFNCEENLAPAFKSSNQVTNLPSTCGINLLDYEKSLVPSSSDQTTATISSSLSSSNILEVAMHGIMDEIIFLE